MRITVIALSTAAILVASQLATAQTANLRDVAVLKCSDLAPLPLANQAALIYYASGYHDGAAAGAKPAPANQQPSSSPASSQTAVSPIQAGGIGLDAQGVITTCNATPSALLADVIAGAGGAQGTTAITPGINTTPVSTTGSNLGTSAAPSITSNTNTGINGPANTSGTDAVNNDLNAASQQLQNSQNNSNLNVQTTNGGARATTELGTTTVSPGPAPAAGTTSP